MAYGNNRLGQQGRSFFQVAGGCIMKFRHPLLAGSIDTGVGGGVDVIDVSAAVKMNDTFLSAVPNQDSAKQEVLVDGSTVTITNHLLNGTLTIPVVPTTGLVATGDFIAALQLVKSSKDAIGGTFEVVEFIEGKMITTLYYGVAVKYVPDKIKMGMDVPVYSVQLLYSGWTQAISSVADLNKTAIHAVGSLYGVEGVFQPYEVNSENNTGTSPMSSSNVPYHGDNVNDDVKPESNVDTNDDEQEQQVRSGEYPYVKNPILKP